MRFVKNKRIGEGTFAVVYEGTDTETGKKVAIKKIKLDANNPGIDISALRELKALQLLKHPNIAELITVYGNNKNLNLVLAHYSTDLERIIKDRSILFNASDIKAWLLMILHGLECIHQRGFIHRDLKPSNLLVGENGMVHIADFGLCREMGLVGVGGMGCLIGKGMTSQVVTLWYRAPELLLGAKYYGGAIDIWAVGCIFAELMLRTPFLPCEGGELAQLNTIIRALGPYEDEWPQAKDLPGYLPASKTTTKPTLKSIFNAAADDALDLLECMLRYDPNHRPTARECLLHPYFSNLPRPTCLDSLYRPTEEAISSVKKFKVNADMKPRKLFTE